MMNHSRQMNARALRELVARRIDTRWDAFAERHGHLAAAIDRVKLTEATARRLGEDPDYQRAMEAAGRDEATLAAALRLVRLIDRVVDRALGL